jgi:hypothetical protein
MNALEKIAAVFDVNNFQFALTSNDVGLLKFITKHIEYKEN